MPQFTITVSDAVAELLNTLATRFGQTPEQIAEQILTTHERVMKPPPPDPEREKEFRRALEASLQENEELYRRLAQH